MRLTTLLLFLLSFGLTYGQADKAAGHVSYTIEFKEMREAKDGYWFEGYLFEIDPIKAVKLKGKKIRISGKYHTVKGITKKTDKNGNIIHLQGREGEYKVVNDPKIKIITD